MTEKKKYGVAPRDPLQLPSLIATCDQCERDTPTKILFMKAGLGNACSVCGRLRRGKPYLSKADFENQMSNSVKGGKHEQDRKEKNG